MKLILYRKVAGLKINRNLFSTHKLSKRICFLYYMPLASFCKPNIISKK